MSQICECSLLPVGVFLTLLSACIHASSKDEVQASGLCHRLLNDHIQAVTVNESILCIFSDQLLIAVPFTSDYIDSKRGRLALFNRSTSVHRIHEYGPNSTWLIKLKPLSSRGNNSELSFNYGAIKHVWDQKNGQVLIEKAPGEGQAASGKKVPFSKYFVCDVAEWQTTESSPDIETSMPTEPNIGQPKWILMTFIALTSVAVVLLLIAIVIYLKYMRHKNLPSNRKIENTPKQKGASPKGKCKKSVSSENYSIAGTRSGSPKSCKSDNVGSLADLGKNLKRKKKRSFEITRSTMGTSIDMKSDESIPRIKIREMSAALSLIAPKSDTPTALITPSNYHKLFGRRNPETAEKSSFATNKTQASQVSKSETKASPVQKTQVPGSSKTNFTTFGPSSNLEAAKLSKEGSTLHSKSLAKSIANQSKPAEPSPSNKM